MKRWIGIVMLLAPLCLSAQSFWDGNATVQRGDAGFESGLFAVSNSFPPDSRIVIQNLDTGQSTTATITQRMDGQPDVLLLLSPMTAAAIGITQGSMARVRVTMASPAPVVPRTAQTQEQVSSRDPDINPGAAYPRSALQQNTSTGSKSPTLMAQASAEPQPSEESLPAAVAPRQQASSPAPVSSPEAPQPETPQPADTRPDQAPVQTQNAQIAAAQNPAQTNGSPPASTADAEAARRKAQEAAIIAAAAARRPQKQLFLPPREDEKFAYHKPAATPAQTAATTPPNPTPTTPAAPQITAVIGEPTASPAQQQAPDLALADAVAPQESTPQEIVGADAAVPAAQSAATETALAEPEPVAEPNKPVQTEVTGPVAVPAPPAKAPQVALATPEAPPERGPEPAHTAQTTATPVVKAPIETPPRHVPVTTTAPRARGNPAWYLQLAAYTTEQIAQDLAKTLVPTYPTLVLAPQPSGTATFRVVIGPLNRAESGTLLNFFRYRGFPDAFLKQE
jgi:hypothetical protein